MRCPSFLCRPQEGLASADAGRAAGAGGTGRALRRACRRRVDGSRHRATPIPVPPRCRAAIAIIAPRALLRNVARDVRSRGERRRPHRTRDARARARARPAGRGRAVGGRLARRVRASLRPTAPRASRFETILWSGEVDGEAAPRRRTRHALPRFSPDGSRLACASDDGHAGPALAAGGRRASWARSRARSRRSPGRPTARALLVLAADLGADRAGAQSATKIQEAGADEEDPKVFRPARHWRRLWLVDARDRRDARGRARGRQRLRVRLGRRQGRRGLHRRAVRERLVRRVDRAARPRRAHRRARPHAEVAAAVAADLAAAARRLDRGLLRPTAASSPAPCTCSAAGRSRRSSTHVDRLRRRGDALGRGLARRRRVLRPARARRLATRRSRPATASIGHALPAARLAERRRLARRRRVRERRPRRRRSCSSRAASRRRADRAERGSCAAARRSRRVEQLPLGVLRRPRDRGPARAAARPRRRAAAARRARPRRPDRVAGPGVHSPLRAPDAARAGGLRGPAPEPARQRRPRRGVRARRTSATWAAAT